GPERLRAANGWGSRSFLLKAMHDSLSIAMGRFSQRNLSRPAGPLERATDDSSASSGGRRFAASARVNEAHHRHAEGEEEAVGEAIDAKQFLAAAAAPRAEQRHHAACSQRRE